MGEALGDGSENTREEGISRLDRREDDSMARLEMVPEQEKEADA